MMLTRLIVLCPGKYTPHRSLREHPFLLALRRWGGTFRAEELDCAISMEFLPLSRRRSSSRNVPGGEERGETDVFENK